jgi:glycosyltransferase involved in cell wall biosynthesis
MTSQKKCISLVIPVFKEEKSIPLFYAELKNILNSLINYSFEIIFVNDGSPDSTWFEIEKLCV